MKRTMVRLALAFAGLALPFLAVSQTRFDHKAPAYVVPEKRVQLAANVTDAKGVKLARVYFKTPAQADYVFVPMTAAGGNRFVATVPAVNASAPSLQYVLLAVNNSGEVSKTQEYTATARKSNETPAWQSASNTGEMKVYTEAATAPQTIAGFSDSISMDVAESTARFGAAVGLLASGGGGAGAGAAASSSGAAGGTTGAAAAGGLSTAAIIGGVAIAGIAAAAAGGGGGGGGSSSNTGGPTTGNPFAGSYSGTTTSVDTSTCSSGGFSATSTCTSNQNWTGTVDSAGTFQMNFAAGTDVCTGGASPTTVTIPASSTTLVVPSNGVVTYPAQSQTTGGLTTSCPAFTITFSSSPRRVTGTGSCTTSGTPAPGSTCNGGGNFTITGS
jgi:hypothetical protein